MPKEEQRKSAAARTLRYYVGQSELGMEVSYRLLEIANMMDNELNESKQIFDFSSEVSTNCLALAEYIHSYVENNGPHTSVFINGLYQYLGKINKQIFELKQDQLMLKLKRIFDHS